MLLTRVMFSGMYVIIGVLYLFITLLIYVATFVPYNDRYIIPEKLNALGIFILFMITLEWQIMRYLLKGFDATIKFIFLKREPKEVEEEKRYYDSERY